MAFKTENVQIAIDVSTQKAVREIAKLQHEFQDITPKVDSARKAVDKASTALEKFSKADRINQTDKWKKAHDNWMDADKAYRDLKNQADNYTIAINRQVKELGVAALTNKELNRYYTDQKRALDGAIRGTEAYEAALKKLHEAQAEKATRKTDVTGGKSFMDEMKGGFLPALVGGVAGGLIAQAGEILSGLFGTLQGMIMKKAEFAKAMGGLAAITGLDPKKDAKDLEYYASAARSMGKEFGVASLEIVKTISIVGSLKPELLKQKEALVSVTQDIITLSKASGDILSIEDSAKAVTGALNQFGESADQSTRYINVMAAGAKAGSSEINETAAAFKISGLMLKTSNISFEQSNALVQALSSKMIKGGEAGTNLRNIFSKLLTGTDELNPAVVGLEKTLEGLSKKSPAEMVKLFGQENVVAAMTLVNMRGEVDNLTKAVTNTNEALDQKNKWVDNLSGDLDKFSTSWSSTWASMMSSSDGFWRTFMQTSTSALDWVADKMKHTKFSLSYGMMPILSYDAAASNAEKLKAENEKRTNDNRKRAATEVNYYNTSNEKLAGGKNIDEKKINGAKATAQMMREKFLEADAQYRALKKTQDNTEYSSLSLRKKQENEKEKLTQLKHIRELAMITLKTANTEQGRIIKSVDENKQLRAKIKEGHLREEAEEAKKHPKKESKADKLAKEQLETQNKINADILKMNVELISNESDKKEAQLRLQYDNEVKANLQLIQDKKLGQAQFDTWLLTRNRVLDAAIVENDKQTNEKAFKAAKEINVKVAKEILEDKKDLLERELNLSKQKDNLAAQYASELQILGINKDIALLEATEDEKLRIIKKYEDAKLILKEKYDDLNLKNNTQKAEKTKKDSDDAEKKSEEKRQKLYQNIGQSIQTVSNLTGEFFNYQKQQIDNQQVKEDKRYNKQISNLEAQKEKGLITEDEFNTKKAVLDEIHNKKTAELKKKAFEADKQARIAQIIMATGQAVMSALATGGIFGTIGAISAGVTGAAQLAIALSQETPDFEAYAKGDFTDNPQAFAKSKPTKSAKAAWVNEEGPEFITNNDGVNSPDFPIMLPLLRKMNLGQAIFPDLRKMMMGNVQGFATGDFTAPTQNTKNYANNSSNSPASSNFDERFLSAIDEFNLHCRNGVWAKLMFSNRNADDFNELLTQNIEVRQRASATKNGNITNI